jgi:hypothetical protein
VISLYANREEEVKVPSVCASEKRRGRIQSVRSESGMGLGMGWEARD